MVPDWLAVSRNRKSGFHSGPDADCVPFCVKIETAMQCPSVSSGPWMRAHDVQYTVRTAASSVHAQSQKEPNDEPPR